MTFLVPLYANQDISKTIETKNCLPRSKKHLSQRRPS